MRTFKSNRWADIVDINSDGQVDQCELAHYLRYLGVPKNECMKKAEIDIQFVHFVGNTDTVQ